MSTNSNREKDAGNSYGSVGLVAAGLAAAVGGLYWLTSNRQQPQAATKRKQGPSVQSAAGTTSAPKQSRESTSRESTSTMSQVYNWLSNMTLNDNSSKITSASPPACPSITNLNSLLSDIQVRYIQIRNDDFQLHYRVFDKIFQHLHQKMKDVDPYYRKYSSTVQFAGSHYDNLRIKKPDEFDMDIVIGLPLNISENTCNPGLSDIYIEPRDAGFVHLRMGVQFQKLPMRDGAEWLNNKAAYEWMDDSFYLQRSKFTDWFKSVASRALNTFAARHNKPVFTVDGLEYSIGRSESGPAFTLFILNERTRFKLDVDLVPALRLPESRWPITPRYRAIPAGCARGEWLVVGKPGGHGEADRRRAWRLALHNQERGLLYNTHNLRPAVRLLKKLRDTLGMKKIASYYIKTLFFWEVVQENDKSFWQRNSPAFLFKRMVGRLHQALIVGKIPYFWNKNNNLIGSVPQNVLSEYAKKLQPLIAVLEEPARYKEVARFLLEPHEFHDYNARFLHI